MKDEIKEILYNLKFTNNDVMWCDKITLDTEQSHLLLDYITNLQEIEKEHKNCTRKHWQQKAGENCLKYQLYKSRNEKAQDLILNELSHLKANDEETWNKEFYDENNKLDYRKLCIELLNQVINLLNGGDEE